MTTSWIDDAYAVLDRQGPEQAVARLEQGGRAGDAACWVELASWYLRGTPVARNLSRSRECFRLAAAQGHLQAQRIHMALITVGVGGPSDWQQALALLAALAGHDESAAREREILLRMALSEDGRPAALPHPEQLSRSPEVVAFRSLLTAAECDFLVERAGPLFQPSVIVDPATGQLRPHPVRTSDNAAFPWVAETPAIHAINRRLAAASETSPGNGEPLQILRYRPGQEYRPHHDALPNTDNQRALTFLLYLNDGYQGGETEFCRTGLRFVGRKGDGLLFRNADAQGRPDPTALHAGRPVTSGEKLLATRWIHERPFGPR